MTDQLRRPISGDDLRERRYQYDLARWGDWKLQQDRFQEILPRAIDVLEDTLEQGGPEAAKVALALVKIANVAKGPVKPERVLIELSPVEEIAAGLPPDEDMPPVDSEARREVRTQECIKSELQPPAHSLNE